MYCQIHSLPTHEYWNVGNHHPTMVHHRSMQLANLPVDVDLYFLLGEERGAQRKALLSLGSHHCIYPIGNRLDHDLLVQQLLQQSDHELHQIDPNIACVA